MTTIKVHAASRILAHQKALRASECQQTTKQLAASTQHRIDAESCHALMARSTPISRCAEQGIKDITTLMAHKGYAPETRKSGAIFYTVFRKGDDGDGDYKEFEVVGWHGQMPRYGQEKSVLELYDIDHGPRPVVTIGAINDVNMTEVNQKRVLKDMLSYLHSRA